MIKIIGFLLAMLQLLTFMFFISAVVYLFLLLLSGNL